MQDDEYWSTGVNLAILSITFQGFNYPYFIPRRNQLTVLYLGTSPITYFLQQKLFTLSKMKTGKEQG